MILIIIIFSFLAVITNMTIGYYEEKKRIDMASEILFRGIKLNIKKYRLYTKSLSARDRMEIERRDRVCHKYK